MSPIGTNRVYDAYCVAHDYAVSVTNYLWDIHSEISQGLAAWRGRIFATCLDSVATLISYSILPSQLYSREETEQFEHDALAFFAAKQKENPTFTNRKESINCEEGVQLDAIVLSHKRATRARDRKVHLYFLGNASLWAKESHDLVSLVQEEGKELICYNYRNTGYSSGFAFKESDLVADAQKVIQRLTDERIVPKNIMLSGRIFGQTIARKAKEALDAEGILVQLLAAEEAKSISVAIHASLPCLADQITRLVQRFGWNLE